MQENIKQSISELLESSFKPELFLLGVASSVSPLTGAAAAFGAGLLSATIPKFVNDKYAHADLFNATNILDILLAGLNSISKDYNEAVNQYNNIIDAVNKDFETYKTNHEKILQKAKEQTHTINRKKALMKEYLLKDLYDALKKCGLAGEYYDMNDEDLDLRMWPIKEHYDLVNKRHLSFIKTFGLSDLSSKGSSILGLLSNMVIVNPVMPPFMLIVSKRIRSKRLKGEIADLEQQVRLNKEHMLSDLAQLETMSIALNNIAGIYSSVVDKYKPIMQMIFRSLETEYDNNINELPEVQFNALFTISRLFKELSEIRILPCSKDSDTIHRNVCEYSNSLTVKYNQIKESIENNFLVS